MEVNQALIPAMKPIEINSTTVSEIGARERGSNCSGPQHRLRSRGRNQEETQQSLDSVDPGRLGVTRLHWNELRANNQSWFGCDQTRESGTDSKNQSSMLWCPCEREQG